jgi:cytochrome P450
LTIYSSVFEKKTQESIDFIEKNPRIENFQDLSQKFALDVLGKTIFDHEFNSLEGSLQTDLEAYHIVLGKILNPYNFLLTILLQKIPILNLIDFDPKFTKGVTDLAQLITNLIEISKKRLMNNEKPKSMLDFMVLSHMTEEMSEEELASNVFIFFLAGKSKFDKIKDMKQQQRHWYF